MTAVTVALLATSVGSGKAADLTGAGISKCEDLMFLYAQPNARDVVQIMVQQWAAGFVSAMNVASVTVRAKARELPLDLGAIEAKARTFCEKKPKATLVDAALDIFRGLPVVN